MQTAKNIVYAAIIGIITFTVSGCATIFHHTTTNPPAKVEIYIQTSSDLNNTESGRSSILPVTFYQLSSAHIVTQPAECQSKLLRLYPGQHRQISLVLQKDTRFIGVVAHYHNLTQFNWRVFIPVDHQQAINKIHLKFVGNKIYVRKA